MGRPFSCRDSRQQTMITSTDNDEAEADPQAPRPARARAQRAVRGRGRGPGGSRGGGRASSRSRRWWPGGRRAGAARRGQHAGLRDPGDRGLPPALGRARAGGPVRVYLARGGRSRATSGRSSAPPTRSATARWSSARGAPTLLAEGGAGEHGLDLRAPPGRGRARRPRGTKVALDAGAEAELAELELEAPVVVCLGRRARRASAEPAVGGSTPGEDPDAPRRPRVAERRNDGRGGAVRARNRMAGRA